MRALNYVLLTGLTFGLLAVASRGEADREKAKHDIKQVMKLAHNPKTGLLGKLKAGKATKSEKKQLLDLYEDLSQNDPPVGEKVAWKKKATAIVAAAKDVVEDKPGAVSALDKATACGACHKEHKPK